MDVGSLAWYGELEEAVRQKRPNDVVAEPLSVVVVSGLNVGDDLGNLSGENMIWVQCSLKIKLGRILKKCTLVHRQIGLLQEDEQLQLWFRNSPEPVGDRDLVASLEAVDGVMVMLAKVVKRTETTPKVKSEPHEESPFISHELQDRDIVVPPSPLGDRHMRPQNSFGKNPSTSVKQENMKPDPGPFARRSPRPYAHASSSTAAAPEPQVQNHNPIALQSLFKDATLEQLERGVETASEILQELERALGARPQYRLGKSNTDVWLDQIQELKSQALMKHQSIVGVVGNTGAGKSSVINALLDEERLVPTNCMRACTAVVTEISYNYDENHRYLATIEFITFTEWEKELRVLFQDIQEGGDMRNKDSEAGIAWAKIKAVYPKMTNEELLKSNPEVLLCQPSIKNILGTNRQIHETDSLQFYKQLQRYVDSNEKTGKPKPGEKKKQHTPKEMEFWPLIKVVKLYIKSEALSTGAVIVDLPGVHDANAARAAVAEGYMKNCTALWIVAPITRAVDDKTAHKLMGQTFRRQLLMDGGFSNVSFICSKIDDISISEATLSLGLEDELWEDNEKLDKLEADLEVKKTALKGLLDTKKLNNDTLQKISEQLEIWEGLQEKADDGKEVFKPKSDSDWKKRKRNDSSYKKNKKARRSDDGIEDFIDDDDIDDDDEPEVIDVIDIEEEDIPLTMEDIDAKITELKDTQKNGRANRRELADKINLARTEVEDLKAETKLITNGVATYCIKERNTYSTTAIKQDFASGLQELDAEAAEARDPLAYDPSAQLRDYEEIARQLPVFCISSRGYQKLMGRLKKDGDAPVFTKVEETGMPALQDHCIKLTEKGRAHSCKRFLDRVSLLINSLSLWTSQSGSEPGLVIANEKFEAMRTKMDVTLKNAITDINDELENYIFNNLPAGENAAAALATSAVDQWNAPTSEGGFYWASYKAICRRNGVFTNYKGHHDWNTQLTEPLIKAIAAEWEKTFTRRIPAIMNTYNAACVSIFQKFHIEIEDEVRLSGGNGEFQLSILERQLVMYQYQLKALVDDTLKLIIQTQRDTNREFVPTICNSMIPAYHYCSNESGIGSFARMKDYVHTHVIYNKETLFKQGSQRVTELLNKLIAETGERLRTAGLAVYEVMKRDYQMLGNPGAMGVMGINGYGTRELSRVLGAVENEFREVLGLARVKEQEDEVDQEMRQAVDFENMVRRQHIAVGLAPQG